MTKIEEMVERFIKQWACIKIDDESMDEPLKLLIQNSASEMRADLMAIVDEATSPIHKELSSLEDKYVELMMAVENKYPNESRHDTATRLIKEAQRGNSLEGASRWRR